MKGRAWARRLGAALAAAGLALFVAAAVMEARGYPWGLLLGGAVQSADSIPDPSPVRLDGEDSAAAVVTAGPLEPSAPPETSPSPPEAALPGDESQSEKAESPPKYVVLGVLKIPAIRVSQNILEGTGRQMKYGVGHVGGTAMPGQEGNCAIAGHRPYPFRYLDKLREGDLIHVKVGETMYTYAVYESFEVLPDEVWVLRAVEGESCTLTLITCTPYMVSSHRLIVRARLVEVDGQPFSPPSPSVSPNAPDAGRPPAGETAPPASLPTDASGEPLPAQETPPASAEASPPGGSSEVSPAESAPETPFPGAPPPA